ncbi:MAG TPA: hypothetical protein VG934_01650 [Candidatus Paceibacterota bacterium]|nr:hypothetical protein [Candidatus Paceibacterota bacterium]
MSVHVVKASKVVQTALEFIQQQYKNGEIISPSEIAFSMGIEGIDAYLLARLQWQELVGKFLIGVTPVNTGLPEHDGLEKLVAILNEKNNPQYDGMFYPVFAPSNPKSVFPVYEAHFRWQRSTPYEDFSDFIDDALFRGGLAALACEYASMRKVTYLQGDVLRMLLWEVPDTYRPH